MSKQILEQIKKLPREERLSLYNSLSEIMNHDRVNAGQGIETPESYWDESISNAYPEKVKTGEVLPGPITTEDVRTGEADKIEKENQ